MCNSCGVSLDLPKQNLRKDFGAGSVLERLSLKVGIGRRVSEMRKDRKLIRGLH